MLYQLPDIRMLWSQLPSLKVPDSDITWIISLKTHSCLKDNIMFSTSVRPLGPTKVKELNCTMHPPQMKPRKRKGWQRALPTFDLRLSQQVLQVSLLLVRQHAELPSGFLFLGSPLRSASHDKLGFKSGILIWNINLIIHRFFKNDWNYELKLSDQLY